VLIQLGIQLLQLVVVAVEATMVQVLLLLVLVVDQAAAVHLGLQVAQLVNKDQEEQEILLLNLRPHPPFKVTLADLELVTIMEAAVVAVLQQLELTLVHLQQILLVQEVLENKTILMVITTTGVVVAVVDLTII
jgi:hypothetical protein